MSGEKDIYSSGAKDGFVSTASYGECYYYPESQINKTQQYNEMDFYRIQDGKKMQPDYIVVFRENSEVKYMEEAKQAYEQWGGLPIVIIDKDKCLEAEKQKVDNIIERYNNGEKHLAGEIWQKVRNNRVTKKNFCEDIDIERFREEAEEQAKEHKKYNSKSIEKSQEQEKQQEKQVSIEDLEENYDKTTPQERKQEVSTIRRINTQIQQIVNEKEGEEVGG